MNEPATVLLEDPDASEPRERRRRETRFDVTNPADEAPTRVCSAGLVHALLARERAARPGRRIEPAGPRPDVAPKPPGPVAHSTQPVRSPMSRVLVAATALARRPRAGLTAACLVLCATWLSANAWLPSDQKTSRAAATYADMPAGEASVQKKVGAPPPTAAATPHPVVSTSAPVSEAGPAAEPQQAVALLAAGDYLRAASAYRALARAHPSEPTYDVVRAVLDRRLAERCRLRGTEGGAPCP